jgi:prepilin-type N-terminal cleavage/methylation domain-containing protein
MHLGNGGGASRGFTLVEMLIALVITSLLISILISSLYYVFRVQDLLHQEVVEREVRLRGKAWFTEALETCLPAAKSSASAFTGNSQEIRCETMAPLEPRRIQIPLRITFALHKEAAGNTQLIYTEQGQELAKPRTIFSWPHGDIHFEFIDSQAKSIDHWPADKLGSLDYQALPSLIRLVVKDSDNADSPDWIVAPRADGWLPPLPQLPLGMKLP